VFALVAADVHRTSAMKWVRVRNDTNKKEEAFASSFLLVQLSNSNPNRSHYQTRAQRKRVAAEKEEQRSECALTFEKSRSKRYKACSDVVHHGIPNPNRYYLC